MNTREGGSHDVSVLGDNLGALGIGLSAPIPEKFKQAQPKATAERVIAEPGEDWEEDELL